MEVSQQIRAPIILFPLKKAGKVATAEVESANGGHHEIAKLPSRLLHAAFSRTRVRWLTATTPRRE